MNVNLLSLPQEMCSLIIYQLEEKKEIEPLTSVSKQFNHITLVAVKNKRIKEINEALQIFLTASENPEQKEKVREACKGIFFKALSLKAIESEEHQLKFKLIEIKKTDKIFFGITATDQGTFTETDWNEYTKNTDLSDIIRGFEILELSIFSEKTTKNLNALTGGINRLTDTIKG